MKKTNVVFALLLLMASKTINKLVAEPTAGIIEFGLYVSIIYAVISVIIFSKEAFRLAKEFVNCLKEEGGGFLDGDQH